MITRRNFLKNAVKGIAGLALPLAALEIVDPRKILAARGETGSRITPAIILKRRLL